MKKMKFVVDCYIPFIEGVLEEYGTVVYASPEEITPELVEDANALLVRTRTRIDENLLGRSKCRFVGTATIGMDHFDLEWCRDNGITAVNAPGCNAPAVAQYVLGSISSLVAGPLDGLKMYVVGVGHVGSIVARWARALDMDVQLVDPPRRETEGGDFWKTLDDATREADVITFHTPLIRSGQHPTFHLGDSRFFEKLERKPIIINSSRGPVVDNAAWKEAIRAGRVGASVIDVWENEPVPDAELLQMADIATPHIAGYSMDGKIRATQMILDSLSASFGLPKLSAKTRPACDVPEKIDIATVRNGYNPEHDTAGMRSSLKDIIADRDMVKKTFEMLRDKYPLRNEY